MTEVIAVEDGCGPSYGPAVPLRPDPSPQKAVPSFTEVGQLFGDITGEVCVEYAPATLMLSNVGNHPL